MSKETFNHPPHPEQSFLDTIIERSKEITLQDGGHQPTLFLEGSHQTIMIPIPEIPETFDGRRTMMFMLGSLTAKARDLDALKNIVFVSEVWLSKASEGQSPYVPPSTDPHRIEVLIINQVTVASQESQIRLFEMVRDKDEVLVKLEPHERYDGDEGNNSESPLINAFIAGYKHELLDD